ncbi:Uncharacterized protein TPAR_05146 [Tolypocladium paradoxum]|uniref:Uncharacterized protein n=1 Tax=Tolypocladium paradoxum TaxID=94208 RepID=A0A2S4KWT2_9HYPO|nr:Uncharacterized protein TPAR_05146 [Tolypocladium paradoxum]
MALINPAYTFVVPFLFAVTVPLAVFAGVTTTVAFSVLVFRVLVVYLDIALSLVPQYLASRKGRGRGLSRSQRPLHLRQRSPSPAGAGADDNCPPTPTQHQQQLQPIYRGRRRRPSNATSVVSAGSTSDMGLGLMPSVGPERDYEGVGGWRSGEDDDESWTTINSRFEYPDRTYARGHHRTPSGGPVTPGDSGVLMMKPHDRTPDPRDAKTPASPNSSRTRTPSASRMTVITMANSDGYFPLAMSPTATKKHAV